MKETKMTNPLLRLTLPAAAVQRLRKSGIYCVPSITVEFQQAPNGTSYEAGNPAERSRNLAIT
jgi:hypothetical protein